MTAINIQGANKESVEEARKAIVAILKAHSDPIAICAALVALKSLCAPNATISHCVFNGGDSAEKGLNDE